MNKSLKALALCMATSFAGTAFGYVWDFTNITNKTLVIKLNLNGTDDDFFTIVQPGRRKAFEWKWGNARKGFCLSNILVGEYNPTISPNFPGTGSSKLPLRDPKNPGLGFDDDKIARAVDERGAWFNALGRQPLRQPKVAFIKGQAWGNFDEAVSKAAEKLTTGITKTAEAALEAAGIAELKGAISDQAGGIISSIMDLVRMGKCIDRHFDILEVKGQIQLYTKE